MKNYRLLNFIAVIAMAGLLYMMGNTMDSYKIRVLNLCGIYIVLSLGLNLINGFTGLFSLGHAGFMAVGAYVSAILTMSKDIKEINFFLKPMNPFLLNIQTNFLTALVAAGVICFILGLLIGIPALKLRDDYLAIATLGFSEIIRVVLTNIYSVTNGSLGLKMIPVTTNIWWSWGVALFFIVFMVSLCKSNYGLALKAVRDDEIAANAMGINIFKTKLLSFAMGSMMAGVGGALLANLLGTIDPNMFRFVLTFNILLIVVLGGMGSISGTVISAVAITVLMEALRILDESFSFMGYRVEGIPGMRMVVFSIMLMAVVLFYSEGIMGKREFSWDAVFAKIKPDMKSSAAKKEVKKYELVED